ncbi:MAG: CAP domain-containing protein, partial [Candidatus Paceibacterota bacterium]
MNKIQNNLIKFSDILSSARGVFLVIILLGIIEMGYLVDGLLGRQFALKAAVLPSVLTQETNEKRIENALPQLSTNPLLVEAAEMKARDMAARGYFSHDTPEGKTPWYWLDQVGYTYVYAGENLAVNFNESSDVTQAWMNSPSHRDNIIKDHYTEIGIATAVGLYKGKEAVFVVQFFGTPIKQNTFAKLLSQNKVTPKTSTTNNTPVVTPKNSPVPSVSEKKVTDTVLGEDVETNAQGVLI